MPNICFSYIVILEGQPQCQIVSLTVNLVKQAVDGVPDAYGLAWWDLEVVEVVILGKGLCLLCRDFPTFRQVAVVAHQNHFDIISCVLLNTCKPVFYAIERIFVIKVECNQYALSLFVEGRCQSAKSLLACSVPDLEVKILTGQLWYVWYAYKV